MYATNTHCLESTSVNDIFDCAGPDVCSSGSGAPNRPGTAHSLSCSSLHESSPLGQNESLHLACETPEHVQPGGESAQLESQAGQASTSTTTIRIQGTEDELPECRIIGKVSE
jgi:hypothetical protein